MKSKQHLLDVVLHPIRIRVIMTVAGRTMTVQQIAEELADVPVASLYRHINRLIVSDVLKVADGRKVRGTVERMLSVGERGGIEDNEKFQKLSPKEHLRYFTAFIASVLDDFSRYVGSARSLDPHADGVGYHKFPLELSDKELVELSRKVNAVMSGYIANEHTPQRKRRIFVTAVIPDRAPTESGRAVAPARTHNPKSGTQEESR